MCLTIVSFVGWESLVAPVNSTPCHKIPSCVSETSLGDVPKLSAREDATSQVEPPLPSVIREALQRKEVQPESID